MNRIVNAYFISSLDPEWEPGFDEVILLAPGLTMQIDVKDRTWTIRTAQMVNNTVIVDLSTCKRLEIGFMDMGINAELSADFLAEASFIEVVRALIGGNGN